MRKIQTGRCIISIMLIMSATIFCGGKKLKTTVKVSQESKKTEIPAGTFTVSEKQDNGYSLSQFIITGYDKPASSEQESFFLTNDTDRTLTRINLNIEYLTPDSVAMHRRFLPLNCDIPAGETRKIDIKSWDRQKSFHYYKSRTSRRATTPYIVRITPTAAYLRY